MARTWILSIDSELKDLASQSRKIFSNLGPYIQAKKLHRTGKQSPDAGLSAFLRFIPSSLVPSVIQIRLQPPGNEKRNSIDGSHDRCTFIIHRRKRNHCHEARVHVPVDEGSPIFLLPLDRHGKIEQYKLIERYKHQRPRREVSYRDERVQ